MVRGFCAHCGKEIGGYWRPPAWQCVRCRRLYCDRCPRKTVGRWFRKPACPECTIEMRNVSHESLEPRGLPMKH